MLLGFIQNIFKKIQRSLSSTSWEKTRLVKTKIAASFNPNESFPDTFPIATFSSSKVLNHILGYFKVTT